MSISARALPSSALTIFRNHRRMLVAGTAAANAAVVAVAIAVPAAAATDTTPPSAPGGVKTAFYGGIGAVSTWSKVSASDLDHYNVYRSASKTVPIGKTATPVATLSSTTLSFTDKGVPATAKYYVAVTAVDKTGNESKASGVVSAAAQDTTAPAAPSGLKLTSGASGITLTWSAVTGAPDLASYQVAAAQSSNGTYTTLATLVPTTTSYVDTTAAAGVSTYYRVIAVDRTGNKSSAGSGSAKRAASMNVAPPSPAGLKAAAAASGGVNLSWTANPSGTTTSYQVSRAASASGAYVLLSSSVTAASYFDATAPAGAAAYYRVTAVNASGTSAAVTTSVSVPKDTTPPAAPAGVKLTAAANGITLSWSAVTALDLASYQVASATSSNGTYTTLRTLSSTTTSYLDTGAVAGANSYYKVTALDTAGNVSPAATGSAKRPTDPTALPATPAGFKAATSTKSAGVVLSWTANAAGTTTGYQLARASSATGVFTVLTGLTGLPTTYTDATAPTGVTAFYRLTAVNAAGSSAPAATSVAVPADTTAPATPSSPKAVVLATGGMTISWSANNETDLAGYRVQKRDGSGTYVNQLGATSPFTMTTFTDTTVTEGKVAYFRIFAIDTSGNTSSYLALTASNPNVAPAAPSSVKAIASATAGINLTWAGPKETDVTAYAIYRSVDSGKTYPLLSTTTPAAVGTAPKFSDTSAPTGVKTSYKITAQDLVGNVSSMSSAVSATSTTAPVALPVVVKVITVGPSGQFATITAALATIPATNVENYELDIAPGTYREKIDIESPHVTLRGMGSGSAAVVITYDTASGSTDPAGGTYGTAGSYTVFVNAKDVTLRNLSVVNAFDEAAHPEIDSQQAVALRVEGDRFVADTVRLIGNQDTLLADTPKPTTRVRQYYVNSYIEGDVDYLFGAADAVFDHDVLHSLDRGKSDNGAITAASTDTGSKYGFLITNSKVVSDAADGTVHLGRPWHPGADPNALASVVYTNTILPSAIASDQPWEDMTSTNAAGVKVNFTWQSARLHEYANLGAGATVNANRPQLSAKDAAAATPAKYLAGSDGWNPTVTFAQTTPATPTGLTVTPGSKIANLAWTDTASADVLGWNVYRAISADGPFVKIATEVPTAQYSDTGLTNGTTYYYAVTAANRSHTESLLSAAVSVTVQAAPLVTDITVDPAATTNGTTVFTTLGAALTAAPAGTATDPTVISLAKGTYAEYLTVAKPYTILLGATGNAGDVVITGNRAAGMPIAGAAANPDGTAATYGTSGSATMVITGNSVQLQDLTVQNNYVEGTYANGQAVALRTTGDKLVLEDVRLLGNQDTFYANSVAATSTARVYVHNSYLEGDVDFVFGRATVVIDHSTLYALDHGTTPNGAVTAASTDKSQKYGFLITDSRIIGSAPDGSQNLGRPWQPGIAQADGTSVANPDAIAQVVVRNTFLGPVVSSTATWTNMVNSGTTTAWQSARFDEYGNTGPGAAVNANRPQLTDAQAATYTAATYLAGTDGWDPVNTDGASSAPAAVTGLVGTGDDGVVNLAWTDNLASNVTGYRVYRAAGSSVAMTSENLVATVTKPVYSDTAVTNATPYSYAIVTVDNAGQTSSESSLVTVTPAVKPLVADITVAADGSGDYTTVAAGIAAAKAGTAGKPTVIFIKPGTYREVVAITKPYLLLKGTSGNAADVVITYDNANGTATGPTTCPAVTTATCGTSGSATVSITAANVTVRDLTIANGFVAAKHPEIGNYNTQAVALKATADKQVYDNVRLLGVQDTLLADSLGNISPDGTGYARQYYVNSFIEGNVDFVFGRAAAVFDRDTFHATAHNGGTIFAPSTASKANGYLVYNSRIVSDNDPGSFYLGRPWRAFSDGAYADNSRGQTVLVHTWMNDGFDLTHPWTDFAPNAWSDGRFAEIGTTGPGAIVNSNRPQLTSASGYTPAAWLSGSDGWNPVLAVATNTAPSAPSGLSAAAGDGQVVLSWTENTDADVVGYRVYRAGQKIGGTLTRAGYTDTGLTNGTAVTYLVTAVDAAGNESDVSAAITATPTTKIDATVAADGSGGYQSVQAAVDADPGTGPWVIKVLAGSYPGTVSIAKNNVTILGATGHSADVVLTNATAPSTLSITGSSVTIQHLTVVNSNGASNTPAVTMTGDKILFTNTALTGTDRTVWADVPTAGATARQMIEGSTITGATNVVLGRASLVIDHSTIVATRTSGTLLIPSTTANSGHGFLVINSTITPAAGVVDVRLGGPYAQGTTTAANAPQAVIRDSELDAGVKSQPWQDFNGYKWVDARFAEYGNSGSGSGVSDLRPQLSPADSVGYTVSTWLGAPTWYPAIADPAAPADVTAPATPADLIASGSDSQISLGWSTDADAASYRLYRSTANPVVIGAGTLVRSGIVTGSYVDSGLVNATSYSYALVAVDSAGNTSVAAMVTGTPADSAPPAAPVGVKAGVGDSRVTLSWTANTEADLAGYRVYRSGTTVALNSTLLTTPAFSETGLTNGSSYAYVVTAVDAAGNESAASAETTAVPAPGDSTPPTVPGGLKAVLGKGSVTLSWSAVSDPDVASYAIYRSTGGAGATKLSSTPSTGFIDSTVIVGTAYTYTVTATDTAGNESAASTAVGVTALKVDVVVAADGSGDATTVSAGIALLPDNADYTGQGFRTILIKPGTYPGVVTVGNRYGVNLVGASANAADTVITAGGTGTTATLTLAGNQWSLRNLTVANTNGVTTPGTQATAVQVKSGDKDVFDNVRLLGDGQTLQPSTPNPTTFSRLYIRNSYLEGGADIVLGRAVVVIDRSTIHVFNRPGASIFDSSVGAGSQYGFLLTNSTVLTDGNAGSVFLSRPYNSTSSQVVVRNTELGAAINNAQPWKDWSTSLTWNQARFFEYQNTGAGAAITNPSTRPQLSEDSSAATWAGSYTAAAYLAGADNWNPTS